MWPLYSLRIKKESPKVEPLKVSLIDFLIWRLGGYFKKGPQSQGYYLNGPG